MACESFSRPSQTPAQRKREIEEALDELERSVEKGSVKVVIDKRSGALTFAGWTDNRDVTDACAYRVMMNRPAVRAAIVRAESLAGTKVNQRAMEMGTHSHDGGKTWDKGH